MTMRVRIWTRCRHCDKCANARRNEWRYRAREEIRRAGRTWFGTLTFSPLEQYRVLVEARSIAGARGWTWGELTDDQRFQRVAAQAGKEVTRYLKRVRKAAKVPLRYICVTERHKSGLPHFHLLVHEVELKPVTHKILSTQWHAGFERWRLVPPEDLRGAGYVTKYLAKEATGRVRASVGYGRSTSPVGLLLTAIKDHQG